MADDKIFLEIDVEDVGLDQIADKASKQLRKIVSVVEDAGKATSKTFEKSVDAGMQSAIKTFADTFKKLDKIAKNTKIKTGTKDLFGDLEKATKSLDKSLAKIGTKDQDIKQLNAEFAQFQKVLKLIGDYGSIAYKDLIRDNKKFESTLVDAKRQIKATSSALLGMREAGKHVLSESDISKYTDSVEKLASINTKVGKGAKFDKQFKEVKLRLSKMIEAVDDQLDRMGVTVSKNLDQNGQVMEAKMSTIIDNAFGKGTAKTLRNNIKRLAEELDFKEMNKKIEQLNKLMASIKFVKPEHKKQLQKYMDDIRTGMTSDIPEVKKAYEKLMQDIIDSFSTMSKTDRDFSYIDKKIQDVRSSTGKLVTAHKEQQAEVEKVSMQGQRKMAQARSKINEQTLKKELKQHKTFWQKIKGFRGNSLFRSFVDIKTFATSVVYLFQRIGRAIGYTIEQFQILETGINQASTLIDNATLQNIGGLEHLRDVAKDISHEFGTDMATTTTAMYKALTSGVQAEALKDVMSIGNQLAVGGGASFDTVLDGVTSIVNAYDTLNYETENLMQVSDAMFTAMKFGKFTLEDLAGNLGQITTAASQMGVDMQETIGILATLTRTGLSAEEASTQIRSTLKTLLDPAQGAKDILDGLGIAYGQTALEGRDLAEYLMEMKSALRDAGYGFQDIFENVRGLQGVLALTGNLADDYNMVMEEMELNMLSTGTATAAAYNKMADSSEMWEKRSKAAWNNAMSQIGEDISPIKKAWDKFIWNTLASAEQKLDSIVQKIEAFNTVNNVLISTFGTEGQFITEEEIMDAEKFDLALRDLYAVAPELAKEFDNLAQNIRDGVLDMTHFEARIRSLLNQDPEERTKEIDEAFTLLGNTIDDMINDDQDLKEAFGNLITDEELKKFDEFIEKIEENGDTIDVVMRDIGTNWSKYNREFGESFFSILKKIGVSASDITTFDDLFSLKGSMLETKADAETELTSFFNLLEGKTTDLLRTYGITSQEEIERAMSKLNEGIATAQINKIAPTFGNTWNEAFTNFSNVIGDLAGSMTEKGIAVMESKATQRINTAIANLANRFGDDLEGLKDELDQGLDNLILEGEITAEFDLSSWQGVLDKQYEIYKNSVLEKQAKEDVNEILRQNLDVNEMILQLDSEHDEVIQNKGEGQEAYVKAWQEAYNLQKITLTLEAKGIENQQKTVALIGDKLDALEEINRELRSGVEIDEGAVLDRLNTIFDGLGVITADMIGGKATDFVSMIIDMLEGEMSSIREQDFTLNPNIELNEGVDLTKEQIMSVNDAFKELRKTHEFLMVDLAKDPSDYEKITDGYGNLLENLNTVTSDKLVDIKLEFEDFWVQMNELNNEGVEFRMTDESVDGLLKVRSILEDMRNISPEIADGMMEAFGDDKFFVQTFLNMEDRLRGIGSMGDDMAAELEAQYERTAKAIMESDEYTMERKLYLVEEAYGTMQMQVAQAERDMARTAVDYAQQVAQKKVDFQRTVIGNLGDVQVIENAIIDLINDQGIAVQNKNAVIKNTIDLLKDEATAISATISQYLAQLQLKREELNDSTEVVLTTRETFNNLKSDLLNMLSGLGAQSGSTTGGRSGKTDFSFITGGINGLIKAVENKNYDAISTNINDIIKFVDEYLIAYSDENAEGRALITDDIARKFSQVANAMIEAEGDQDAMIQQANNLGRVIESLRAKLSAYNSSIDSIETGLVDYQAVEGKMVVSDLEDPTDEGLSGRGGGSGGSKPREYQLSFDVDYSKVKADLNDLYQQMYDFMLDTANKRKMNLLDLMIDVDADGTPLFDEYKDILRDQFGDILGETDGFISEWEKRLIEAGMMIDDRRTEWENKIKDLYLNNANTIADALRKTDEKLNEVNSLSTDEYTSTSIEAAQNKLTAVRNDLWRLVNEQDMSMDDIAKLRDNIAEYVYSIQDLQNIEGGSQYDISGDLGYAFSDEFVQFMNELSENLSVEELLDEESAMIMENLRNQLRAEVDAYVEGNQKEMVSIFKSIPAGITDFYARQNMEVGEFINNIERLSESSAANIEMYTEQVASYMEYLTNETNKYTQMTLDFMIDMDMGASTYGENIIKTMVDSGLATEDMFEQLEIMGYTIADIYKMDGNIDKFREITTQTATLYQEQNERLIQIEQNYQEEYSELVAKYGEDALQNDADAKKALASLDDKFKAERLSAEYEYRQELFEVNQSFQRNYMTKMIEYYEGLDHISENQQKALDNLKEGLNQIKLQEEFGPILEEVGIIIESTKNDLENIFQDLTIAEGSDISQQIQQVMEFDYASYRRIMKDRDKERNLRENVRPQDLSEEERKFLKARDEMTMEDTQAEDAIIEKYEEIQSIIASISSGEMLDGLPPELREQIVQLIENFDTAIQQEADLIDVFNSTSIESENASKNVGELNKDLMSLFDLVQQIEATKFLLDDQSLEGTLALVQNQVKEAKEAHDFYSDLYTNMFDEGKDFVFEYTKIDPETQAEVTETLTIPADIDLIGMDDIQDIETAIMELEAAGNLEAADGLKERLELISQIFDKEQEIYDLQREAYQTYMEDIEERYNEREGTGIFGLADDLEMLQEMKEETEKLIPEDTANDFESIVQEIKQANEEVLAWQNELEDLRNKQASGEELDAIELGTIKDLEAKIEYTESQIEMLEKLKDDIESGNMIATEEDLAEIEKRIKEIQHEMKMNVVAMVDQFVNSINSAISGDGEVDWGKLGNSMMDQAQQMIASLGPEGQLAAAIIGAVRQAIEVIQKLTTDKTERNRLKEQEILLKRNTGLIEARNKLAEMYKLLNHDVANSMKEQNQMLRKNIEYQAKLRGDNIDLSQGMAGVDKQKEITKYNNLLAQQQKTINDIYTLEKDIADDNIFDDIGNWFVDLVGSSKEERLAELEARKKYLDNEIKQQEELIQLIKEYIDLERKRLEQYGKYYSQYFNLIGDQNKAILAQINIYDELLSKADFYGLSQEQVLDYMLKQSQELDKYVNQIQDRFKKEQDLMIKRAQIAGYTEEQIRDIRRQANEDQIKLLEAQLAQTEGYDARLEIENKIADLMLERLDIEKEINGELDDRNVLYDEQLRKHLRSVIEARKLKDETAEMQGLIMSAERMLELGVTPDEIYRLLGIDVGALGITSPTAPPAPATVGGLPDVDDVIENQTEALLSMDELLDNINTIMQDEVNLQMDSITLLTQIRDTLATGDFTTMSEGENGQIQLASIDSNIQTVTPTMNYTESNGNAELAKSINNLDGSIQNLTSPNVNNNIGINISGNQKVETFGDVQRAKVYQNQLYNK